MSENFDLFGDPIPEVRNKAGRPPHVVTVKNRNKVIMLTALGWNNPRIANSLSISLPTLRKNYFHELKARDIARDRLDAARFELVWDLAKSGNVGAIKEFGKMLERNDQMIAEASFYGDRRPPPEEKPVKMGKKEVAAVEAATAGENSEWGDDLLMPGLAN